MRPGRAADHSPPSSAAVMEEYSYTSTNPLGHTGPVTGSLYVLFSIKLNYICSVRTVQQTQSVPAVNTNLLILWRKMISVRLEIRIKNVNTL